MARVPGPVVATSATGDQLAMGAQGPAGPPGPAGVAGPQGGAGPGVRIIIAGGSPFPQELYLNVLSGWATAPSATDVPGSNWTALQLGGTITDPTVTGVTTWVPKTLAPATRAETDSAKYTAQTTSGSHTSVQVGPNIPLPGSSPTAGIPSPPSAGGLTVTYKVSIESTTLSTPAGAIVTGIWSWSVKSSTIVSKGSAQSQPTALGTASGGALPTNWAVTLQQSGGYASVVVTTDASDTYTIHATLEWDYTE